MKPPKRTRPTARRPDAACPQRFNFAEHLLAANRGRARQGRLHRRPRHAHATAQLDERVRRLAAGLRGARAAARGARAAADAGQQRLAGGLPRRAVRRRRAGGGQHAADAPTTTPTCWSTARAQAVLVSGALLPALQAAMTRRRPRGAEGDRLAAGRAAASGGGGVRGLRSQPPSRWRAPRRTGADDPAFWLYSSGSTGRPKGTVHTHANPYWTGELYGKAVLGLTRATTSASRPPSCSSPTGSATRSPSRWRWAPRCC